jgi:hypothetical protein
MDKSENLEAVVFSGLIHEELGHSGDDIEDEVSSQVILANVDKILMCSGLFNEVEQDLDQLDDVDSNLKFVKLILPGKLWVNLETANIVTSKSFFWSNIWGYSIATFTFVEMRENIQIWRGKQGVDRQHGDQEIPDLAEGSLSIDEIPLELWLRIDDLVVFVGILVNIVNHHFFEVGLRHLLKTSLKPELVVVTSSLAPKRLDSLFLLGFSHFAPIVGVAVIALVDITFGTAREQHLQEAWVRLTALLR